MTEKLMYEFCKLDSIDLKVASWIFYHCPHSLDSYLEFISIHDYLRKGILVNTKKVSTELLEVYATSMPLYTYT